jgi:hypothetical protein
MEQIECSETSAIINQTPGNHPKEDILYSKHGESLKSRMESSDFKHQTPNYRTIYGPKYEDGKWKSRTNRELAELSKGENIVK